MKYIFPLLILCMFIGACDNTKPLGLLLDELNADGEYEHEIAYKLADCFNGIDIWNINDKTYVLEFDAACVDSIIAQEYFDWDVLVNDANSGNGIIHISKVITIEGYVVTNDPEYILITREYTTVDDINNPINDDVPTWILLSTKNLDRTKYTVGEKYVFDMVIIDFSEDEDFYVYATLEIK